MEEEGLVRQDARLEGLDLELVCSGDDSSAKRILSMILSQMDYKR